MFRLARLFIVITAVAASACMNERTTLAQLVHARRIASELHVEFTKASDASNRAVMADTDDASADAADEARQARHIVERDTAALRPILDSLGYGDDIRYLKQFVKSFEEYRRLDDEVLPLAVENTNVKAQRLSFGPAREAADAFRKSLDEAERSGAGTDARAADALAGKAVEAVLEVEVLQAPHIAESDDARMTRIEQEMDASVAAAREALEKLKGTLPQSAGPQLTAASAALDRFVSINDEIVALSRRNSNVRSLALSLGRKRMVTAECEDQLRALEDALAKHEFAATR